MALWNLFVLCNLSEGPHSEHACQHVASNIHGLACQHASMLQVPEQIPKSRNTSGACCSLCGETSACCYSLTENLNDVQCLSMIKKTVLERIIELYEYFPCLWDVKKKEHSKKHLKMKQY